MTNEEAIKKERRRIAEWLWILLKGQDDLRLRAQVEGFVIGVLGK